MKSPSTAPMTWEQFTGAYCETQESTPEQLQSVLRKQTENLHPKGWMLLECHVLDSSYAGQRTILPFGGAATHQEVPDHPISPRGLASDMSVVIGVFEGPVPDAHPKGRWS